MRKVGLLLLVCFALGVRLIRIGEFPPSLNWDEASLGYNAYSQLMTGRDEWGTAFPTIFRAFGDYKLPGYVYATVPFIKLFGLTELSVRLTSIISGTLLVAVVYILSKRIHFRGEVWSLLAALLVAISPWFLFLSRVAVEANFAIFLFTLGVTLLLYRRLTLGVLFLALSAWTYNSFRLFTPIFMIAYSLLNIKLLNIKHYALFFIFFIPLVYQLLSPSGQARFKWLTLLDEGAIAKINQLQTQTGNRLLYNKATYLLSTIAINYVNHFHPNFLFFKGGSHYQFSIPNHGLLYAISLPFFYLGLVLIIFKFHSQSERASNFKLLLLWLLLAPIASSLTRDSPHTLRAIPLLPAVVIITAFGVSAAAKKVPYLLLLFTIIVLLSFEYYLTSVAPKYRATYSQSWQYGYKEAVHFIKDSYSQYDQVIFTKYYGEPHEFVAFYWPWDPINFQKSKVWDYHANWYWINGLDKIKFVVDREMADVVATLPPGKKYLIISDPKFPTAGNLLTTINFLDSQPAFIIKEL